MNISPSKPKRRIFYCYALCDPRKPGNYTYGPRMTFSHEPFYIGYGHNNRSEQHVKVAKRSGHNSPKENKIRKILSLGLEVVVVRTKTLSTARRAQVREIELIEAIGRADLKIGPLTNLNSGGFGGGNQIAESTRVKMRAAKLGKPRSLESRIKQSITATGQKRPAAGAAKAAASQRGLIRSEETKRKISEAKKGVKMNPDAAKRAALARVGMKKKQPYSAESLANMSAAQKGGTWSDARRAAYQAGVALRGLRK